MESASSENKELNSSVSAEGTQQTKPAQPVEVAITKVPVTDQNISLQLLIAFVQLAHRRSAYNIEETAKIHECIEMFKVQQDENNSETSA